MDGSWRLWSKTIFPVFTKTKCPSTHHSHTYIYRYWGTLRALLSSTFLQTLPDLVTPLKGTLYLHAAVHQRKDVAKQCLEFERHCDSSISGLLWVWLSLTLTSAPVEARVQRYLWLNLKQQLTVTPLPMFIISVWFACSILSIIIQSMVVVGLPLGQSGHSFRSILKRMLCTNFDSFSSRNLSSFVWFDYYILFYLFYIM